MKSVARMELKPGMVVAEDVLNYQNEIIVSKNTKINDTIIEKLARQSILVVPIKEEADFATTHFEKVRLTEGFKAFESTYRIYFPVFKNLKGREEFPARNTPFPGWGQPSHRSIYPVSNDFSRTGKYRRKKEMTPKCHLLKTYLPRP